MNRRAAIGLLLSASAATASDQLTFSAHAHNPIRRLLVVRPDGYLEFPLDDWSGMVVTFGGHEVTISATELFGALSATKEEER